MAYTAAALSAASRPVTITIGRVSDRRGWQWLSRWWVQRCRTWTAKPLSVPQMLALQASGRDPVQQLITLYALLRAVLPRRWWYRVVGDPVRLLFALPEPLMKKVLMALVTVPNTLRDVSAESESLLEAIRREQRELARGSRPATGGSLAVAALSVREVYGDAWYYDPQRWPTSDGYVPYAVALVEYEGVQALQVRRRLEIADGFTIAHGKPSQRRQMERMAYPQEVC